MYQETAAQKRKPAAKRAVSVAESNPAPSSIDYTVGMSKPWTHLLEVEMRIKWKSASNVAPKTELKLPVWTPGSYLVREYARHVQSFAVKDGAGKVLNWQKTNKNTWQIETSGIAEVVATYKVYSNELTVRTNELNDDHAFWNNAALLMFPKGQLGLGSTVRVMPHGTWKVATGLPEVAGEVNTFTAENYDVLYDSPFEVSDFTEIKFEVLGKPHRYVISGEGNYDPERLVTDTTKIIEATAKIFGDELPYKDYTFILNLRGGGGLEHLNSTALQTDRFAFKNEGRYRGFLGLVAHEYFHVWNVKRIRPDALGPFDYENENYTKLLWVAEGATAYYEHVVMNRAGLIDAKDVLNNKAGMIKQLQERPGRFETSLEEASMDAWIKYYRQDENSINNQISYYDKGEIVNMMLDIVIRTSSNGVKSLDDVMRQLYADFFKKGKNYTPDDFQKAAEAAAGKGLEDFFAKYVRGREELDFDGIVNGIGLTFRSKASGNGKVYFGANLAEENGRFIVRSLPAGSPAYEQGINTGDQIVAIDGNRASQGFMQMYFGDKKPGDTVKLTIFRFDRLREITFTLGADTRKDYSFAPQANASDEQKRLYNEYLNADL